MNFIKKLFITFITLLITFLVSITLLTLVSREGYLDEKIKKIVEFYLNKKGITVIIGDLQIKNNILSINQLSVKLADKARGEITNLKINFNVDGTITNPLIFGAINIDKFAIVSKDNQQIIESAISSNYIISPLKKKIKTNVNLTTIKSTILAINQAVDLPIGTGHGLSKTKIFTNTTKKIDRKLPFAKQAHLSFNTIISKNGLQIYGNVANMPIMIYQVAAKIISNNEVILFLQKYIKSGNIEDGTFDLNLSKDWLKTNILPEEFIKAKLHITNLEYNYDQDFPALKKLDTNIIISGSSVKFLLNQAYSGNSLISNGIVNFKWKGMVNSNFIVNATATGPIIDLIDFIPDDIYKQTKARGINLKNSLGRANTNIAMTIPISPHIKNSYHISTVLSDVQLKAFNDNLVLQNAKITGTFNGDKINLTGTGKINNYASNFTYQHNVTKNNHAYESLLKVTANISSRNQKISILRIMSGNSVLNFEYKKQKDGQEIINAKSDLTNLEFHLDKISIYKKLHKSANLAVQAKFDKNLKGDVNFNLLGDDNLKIVGKISIKDNDYNIFLPIISHNDTNVTGKIVLDQDNINVELQGGTLDLSKANMMQFLEKELDPPNIGVKINLDKVKLKHDIWLDKLRLRVNCNKIKCFASSLEAKIGPNTVQMSLITQDNLEQWMITSDNAGDLLKGIGMYNNMRGGTIDLIVNTKRKEDILNGTFSCKNFSTTTNMPILVRIISFVSLPGFVNAFRNKTDISFNEMTGKFSYSDKIITILDTSALGPFFDLTMYGTVNTNTSQINLKGNIIPSFFWASTIITKIPIIGTIARKIFTLVPYSINEEIGH